MKLIEGKVRTILASSGFTRKELQIFKQKLRPNYATRKMSKSELQDIIQSSAMRALRDVFFAFFAMLFLQIPFLTSAIQTRNLDFLFILVAFVFLVYVIIYVTAGIRKMPVCTQFKLVKLAVRLLFSTRL